MWPSIAYLVVRWHSDSLGPMTAQDGRTGKGEAIPWAVVATAWVEAISLGLRRFHGLPLCETMCCGESAVYGDSMGCGTAIA